MYKCHSRVESNSTRPSLTRSKEGIGVNSSENPSGLSPRVVQTLMSLQTRRDERLILNPFGNTQGKQVFDRESQTESVEDDSYVL